MTRFSTFALAALLLVAAPAAAQTTPAQAPAKGAGQTTPSVAPATAPPPGSEEWLRLRGESYNAAPEAELDPAEVAETIRLNAEIAARNNAAERREIEGTAAWQAEDARWRAEVAQLETRRARWEADAAAAEAARLRYEGERATWAAEVAACQRSPRSCVASAPKD